jgi:hypothetical protein
MKLIVVALATAAIIGTGAHAQNSRVLEPEARPGQPTVGRRKPPIRGRPQDRLPLPCPALGRHTERKVAPLEVLTLIAFRQELRAARAGLRANNQARRRGVPPTPRNRWSGPLRSTVTNVM